MPLTWRWRMSLSWDLKKWPLFLSSGGDSTCSAFIDQLTIDSRRIESPHSLFVALPGQEHDGHQFVPDADLRGAAYALVKENYIPAVPLKNMRLLRVPDPLRALQDLACWHKRQMPAKILAITGSQGKTMVKDLLAQMLEARYAVYASPESFNSQLGVALSLLGLAESHEIAIIEAGISHPGEMERLSDMLLPNYAIFSSLGHTHLATLGSKETIAKEKMRLLQKVDPSGWSLLPHTPLLLPYLETLKAPHYFWDIATPFLPHAAYCGLNAAHEMTCSITFPSGRICQIAISSGIDYYLSLVNAALKAAYLLGVEEEALIDRLHHFLPQPMQTEIWSSPFGPTFINAPYCADPMSLRLGLKELARSASPRSRKIFVFGGLRGNVHYSDALTTQITHFIRSAGVDQLYLTGTFQTPYLPIDSQDSALQKICDAGSKEDIVLIQGAKKENLDPLIGETRLSINLSAIQYNLGQIAHYLPNGTRIMVMVKALGYGTDSVILSRFLARCGIDCVGVAHVDEGIALKRAGISQAVFVLNAALYEVNKAVLWDLEVGVSNLSTINALNAEAAKLGKKVKVHLHCDTGMSRLGCRPDEALSLAKAIQEAPGLIFEGIMTHFAAAESREEDPFTLAQIEQFHILIDTLRAHAIQPGWTHAANTGGILRFSNNSLNMVRLGLGLFGLHPSAETQKALSLKLAVSLTSRLVGINICRRGETISYGRTYTVKRDKELIGVVPIGYFDGLHRHYSGKGHVLVRGKKAPMVGTICMDYMMIDITDIPDAAIGDPVLIFGQDRFGHYLEPEAFAQRGDTTAYELLTCLGPRIQRVFIHDER